MHYTVFDFAGTGGVALAMYNTDAVCVSLILLLLSLLVIIFREMCVRYAVINASAVFCFSQSIRDFAHSSFQMALSKGLPLFMR